MSKMKIEIRKPQYLAAKEPVAKVDEEVGGKRTPFFFRLLLVATYMLSGLAIWYVYQRYSAHS
ncbi:MAG: hypothetical protein HY767_02250 [Candidatus Omnitrophica bacterium]|nr:hypothetical protein [Candidatus Omnitrophota bacterium]